MHIFNLKAKQLENAFKKNTSTNTNTNTNANISKEEKMQIIADNHEYAFNITDDVLDYFYARKDYYNSLIKNDPNIEQQIENYIKKRETLAEQKKDKAEAQAQGFDEYQINDSLIVKGELKLANVYLDNSYVYAYCLKDIYGNNLWTNITTINKNNFKGIKETKLNIIDEITNKIKLTVTPP